MHTITPHLVCKGAAAAIEFYKEAFGATEVDRLAGPDGKLMHAMLRIGDSAVMLVDEFPEMHALGPAALGGTAVTLHLSVPDADASFARATRAGATPRMPVTEMFWGARYGLVEDPFGHLWSIATQVEKLTMAQDQREAMRSQPAIGRLRPEVRIPASKRRAAGRAPAQAACRASARAPRGRAPAATPSRARWPSSRRRARTRCAPRRGGRAGPAGRRARRAAGGSAPGGRR